jgi:O-antigen/teichoic acid export membrane protein
MGLFQKLITPLEKLFQLDLRYYIRNSSYLITSQVVGMGLSVLLSIVFSRVLAQEEYGHWNFVLSVGGMVSVFALTGMGVAIIQAVARGHGRALISGTKERFKWSGIGSVIILGVGAYYYAFESVELGRTLMVSSLFFPFFEIFKGYASYLSGKKEFGRIAKYDVISQLIAIPATVAAIYLSKNLLVIIIVYYAGFILLRGWFFRRVSREARSQTDDAGTIPFGRRMTLVDIPSLISVYGDKIIIGIILSFPDLAVYSIALGAANFLRYVTNPITTLSMPKLAAMPEQEAYAAVKRRYGYVFLFMLAASGFCIWLYQYLIPFLYTDKYVDSILYAQILIGSIIFGIPNSVLTRGLFPAHRKAGAVLRFEIVRVVVRTILLVVLTLKFGLIGVPITITVTSMITMVYSWKLAGWI